MVRPSYLQLFVQLANLSATGDSIGIEMEQGFFKKAKEAGLSDEEAKSAFNSNMMATGLLSEFPAEFAREHGRRWLISAYEAGDVVLHKPHMVSTMTLLLVLRCAYSHTLDSRIDHQP